ncbi:MAG: glycosyltransferase [Alphaproteobacteria bacterium]
MRLLQTMAGSAHGGAEVFFVRLAGGLARAGLSQRLIIRCHDQRAAQLRDHDRGLVELPFGGPIDVWTRAVLKREIRRFAPDVVLSWMNRASVATPMGPYPLIARLGGYYNLKYYRHCDHLIGNTRDIVAYLVDQGWPSERAHYLPNFVDDVTVAPVARGDLATPEDVPLVLALGRLHGNKAFDILLQSLVDVPGAWLWLAGEGPDRDQLESLARGLGIEDRVRFLGWRDDTAALLAACDLFVCPSRHEPLGNVVIEAWAAEKPVVAARSAGPVSLIEDGVSGRLVEIDDASALAGAMTAVLADGEGRASMAQAGRAAYERDFTEGSVVGQYLAFFESVRKTCAVSPG